MSSEETMAISLPDFGTEFPADRYLDRELSWLAFNQRVLEEALDGEAHPLLERVKFISIFSSNLDEYFMIRVAGIEDQYEAGIQDRTIDGHTPFEQLEKIRMMVLRQLSLRNQCFYHDLVPALEQKGIEFLRVAFIFVFGNFRNLCLDIFSTGM
jgi:polyphosphate kinase